MTSLAEPQDFLRQFFGSGNKLSWEEYEQASESDPMRVALAPWVSRVEQQTSPYCLPRVDPQTQQTSWYVLCGDAREARSMRESLQAFIGPSYASFNGEQATLINDDEIDHLCKEQFGPLVFRLTVKHNKERTKVASLLTRLIEFRDRRSGHSLTPVKPIGRLLRDLDMAILAGNEDSAWQIYAELRTRGRLTSFNFAFLKIHILHSFDKSDEILGLPNLGDLLQIRRRPKRISEHIATAVYRQDLQHYEEADDVSSSITAMRSYGGRYDGLVGSTDGWESPDAVKFALLAAVAADPPRRSTAQRICSEQVTATDRDWCESLLKTLPPETTHDATTQESPLAAAERQYHERHFDEAFKLYLALPPTERTVARVLETAIEVETKASAEQALAYLESCSEEVQGDVLSRKACVQHIEALTEILGVSSDDSQPLASLIDWFQRVDDGADTDLISVLQYGLQDWASGTTLDVQAVAEQLTKSRSGPSAQTVRNAVPKFIREFLVEQTPSREHKPIYRALVDLLIYDEAIGSDDLSAVEQLLEVILTVAPSQQPDHNDFAFAVDATKDLWEAIAAPRHLDWSLSTLDLLIDAGASHHADLTPLLSSITSSMRTWARRVSESQWSLLELLAADLNLTQLLSGLRPSPPADSPTEDVDIRSALQGKSIAVYSLTERIARRFGQLAEQAFDDIKLHYLHDKALTDRMKSLAQSADIFIVNTWDAKHAATNGIKDNRPSDKPTLEPTGKSASALFATLLSHCEIV